MAVQPPTLRGDFLGAVFMRPRSDFLPPTFITFITHGLTTTDDFEVDDDTTTTDQLYQEYYANLYALGFRLVVS